ncbi:MarR family transcriptional regulator [Corynebacterium marquesiae]|uniref:MarR family transcriptional regulator n=1 Tax=Corynebacterium marquesiae TaxID=2913503 RepID=UPI00254EE9AB|nr:MarR family transcriptional regulator [Corynebacterium marquesiae]MDK8668950.1 MarR family transcriptional regulator [Corynebacterium marquesiae]
MSPTEKVKEAIKQGKSNPVEIAKATGLGQGTVEVILAHLERSAELVRESLTSCPTGGCGSCAQAGGCSGAVSERRGPVLLQLRRHS